MGGEEERKKSLTVKMCVVSGKPESGSTEIGNSSHESVVDEFPSHVTWNTQVCGLR